MKSLSKLAVAAVVVAALAGDADAQRGARGRGGPPPDVRIGQMVQQQLGLTAEQSTKLQETNNRFQQRRQALGAEERRVRMTMRDMLCSGDTTRTDEMNRAVDQWLDLMSRRVALTQEEQREMATYLTPYQRARWLAIEERVRARADQMLVGRGRGRGMRGDGPPPGPPPDSAAFGGRGGRRGGPPPDVC